MAITLADFQKIWASTSPLTPYSFSEANYKQGWNFIGSTPPARQMWDFLQKNNDEKMQYLANNYLPLSGGTMTGYLTMGAEYIKRSVDNASLTLCGGTSFSNGAYISFNGKDRSSNAGVFSLVANDGTNSKVFYGTPDGTLVWGGNNVITSAVTGNIVAVSGTVEANGTTLVDICSITQHEAGVWVITGYVELSTSVANANYSFNLTDGVQGTTVRNISGAAGGGASTSNILSLAKNAPITLKGWLSESVQTNLRGRIKMVRLS